MSPRTLLGLLLIGGVAAAEPVGVVWQGTLEVQEQQGNGCAVQRAPPYQLPVYMVRWTAPAQGDTWFSWGAMQAALLQPAGPDSGVYAVRFFTATQSDGEAQLSLGNGSLRGRWSETGAETSSGCNWTQAALSLQPVASAEAAQALRVHAQYLYQAKALQRQLQGADRIASQPLIERMVTLAREMPEPAQADKGVAQAFLEAGELAAVMRLPSQAARLLHASSNVYRRLAQTHPDDAALALSREAEAVRRQEGLPAAVRLMDEALAMLDLAGRGHGATASNLLNMLGAWRLRDGQIQSALDVFQLAADIDQVRQAPADEHAMSLNNLAQALQRANRLDAAEQMFERALVLAEHGPAEGGSLAQVIRNNLAVLRSRADRSPRAGARPDISPRATSDSRVTLTAQPPLAFITG